MSEEEYIEDAVDETLMAAVIPENRSLRLTFFLIMEGGLPPWDKFFQAFILLIIFGNVSIFVVSTVEWIAKAHTSILVAFECFTIIVFMVEYGLRMWCIIEKADYGKMGPVMGRIAHMVTFGAVIDVVSILPFWIDLVMTIQSHNNTRFYGVRVWASLRILRIFQLFKADKYTASMEVMLQVFKARSRVLGITGVMGLILFLFTSTALYFAQGSVDPECASIPAAFFTAALLLTGQGYWNPAPVTPAGKWVIAISNVFSVAVFAIPAGILASGLEPIGEEIHDRKKEQRARRTRALKASKTKARRRRMYEGTAPEATILHNDHYAMMITSDEDPSSSGESHRRNAKGSDYP
jgi:voltage-gated potassium channel